MNIIRSLIIGSLLRINQLHNFTVNRSPIVMVSHVGFSTTNKKVDGYDTMTVKELRKILTEKKIKGRSRLTRKSEIVSVLRSL